MANKYFRCILGAKCERNCTHKGVHEKLSRKVGEGCDCKALCKYHIEARCIPATVDMLTTLTERSNPKLYHYVVKCINHAKN